MRRCSTASAECGPRRVRARGAYASGLPEVSDPALHLRVCEEVREWVEGLDFHVQGIVESPITGPEGNVEFLISASRN